MNQKELMSEIQAVDSIVKLAANLKPIKHKNTGLTRKETEDLIGETVIMIQTRLVAYVALQAAVKLSNDNEAISKKALELYDAALKEIGVKI
jgi:hypothetical protein